jgi:hypothetical protein
VKAVDDCDVPINVRLVLRGGQEVAVEGRYNGLDEVGMRSWIYPVPRGVAGENVVGLHCERLPARTTLKIGWRI